MKDVTQTLADEIAAEFPILPMPPAARLVVAGSIGGQFLIDELEMYRDKQIDGHAIRLVHQELPHLTAEGIQWVLPHYLRFCLTPEAQYNREETEYLVYHLGPSLKFQGDTAGRLSLLSSAQVRCLIDFLQWCGSDDYWREYCPEDLKRVEAFLATVLVDKERRGI